MITATDHSLLLFECIGPILGDAGLKPAGKRHQVCGHEQTSLLIMIARYCRPIRPNTLRVEVNKHQTSMLEGLHGVTMHMLPQRLLCSQLGE